MNTHQKRISAPRSWNIERKVHRWAVKPRPGPHPKERSIPLLLIIRDMLKLADNSKEAKRILHEGDVIVNGKVRKDHKFPVGIFDILSIPLIKADYMVLLDKKGRLTVQKIGNKEADKKLCRVDDKTMIKGGKIQLNLHDGRNILLPDEESKEIKTHDSLMISLKDNKILHHYAYKKGNKAMVIGGKHSAQIGEIEEIKTMRSFERNVVKMKGLSDSNAQGFETIEDYAFVVGEDRIELPILRLGLEEAAELKR